MADALQITTQALGAWMAPKKEAAAPREPKPRGRPRALPPDVRARLRRCYDDHLGEWGPSVLAAWAERNQLGRFCPSTISHAIEDLREAPAPKPAPAQCDVVAAGVMWSEDGAAFREAGRKKELLVVQDEHSRYKVNHRLVDGPAKDVDVHDYLEEAFKKYGAPLVLKQDNGTVLRAGRVLDLLARWQVTLLCGPRSYPQYNGKKERSFRDVRSYERAAHHRHPWMPLHDRLDAAIHDLNDERPRPVLHGRVAHEVFREDRCELPDRARFIEQVRNMTLKLEGEAVTRDQLDSAGRRAVEVVLLMHGLLRLRRSLSSDSVAESER